MCHQIQRSIADLEQKGGSEESSPGIPARWDDEREYFAAWRTLGVWKAWVTTKPAAYGITHIKIQATLRNLALPSDETTIPLNTLTGFRVMTHMAVGDSPRLVTTIFLSCQSRWRSWWGRYWRSSAMLSPRRTMSTGSASWRTASGRA